MVETSFGAPYTLEGIMEADARLVAHRASVCSSAGNSRPVLCQF